MHFTIKNVGLVNSIKIDLKGLTVITGLNDTGKSFISKTIYSVIKTISDADLQSQSEIAENITNLLNQIFALHRQSVSFTQEKLKTFGINEINNTATIYLQNHINDGVIEYISKHVNNVINDIKLNSNLIEIHKEGVINNITLLQNRIIQIINEIDNEKVYEDFFRKIIVNKFFQSQFVSLTTEEEAHIIVGEGDSDLLDIKVSHKGDVKFNIMSQIFLKDVTMIDSPVILQLERFITSSLAFSPLKTIYQQRTNLPYYHYDLVKKLSTSSNSININNDITSRIKEIIGGEIVFDQSLNEFVFSKNNEQKIRAFNIANGIRSLGIIQLLLSSEAIEKNRVLIIDEPEVHLHPGWEIQYAEIIVLLCKFGVPVIISSHSPYLLEAIYKYSIKYKITEKTNFYFGEKDSNGCSIFRDVSDNLEPIFKYLAKPMKDLSQI